MTQFVDECRQEWKRLGVPDVLAAEMATDLEADLAEAEADGVSAAELLGESDPHVFAATWARERGLAPERQTRESRRRLWIVFAVALVLLGTLLGIGAIALFAKPTIRTSRERAVLTGPPPHLVRVPRLVGLQLCRAQRIAHARRFRLLVRADKSSCKGNVVVHQRPSALALVPRHWPMALRSELDPVRVPNLVGRSECTAENILAPLGFHVRQFDLRPCRHRRIVSQTPAAGRMLQPPHAVTVRLRGTTR